MSARLTVQQFFARFPDEEACLRHVMNVRFGLRHVCRKCAKEATFHRMATRRAFACSHCGDHVYPTAGTVFQDTRTPLQSWFYAIYLFVTTRHGVSGKELQRTLGVTYKTAWRMGHQIRKQMESADVFQALRGHVEIDETYVGGVKAGVGKGYGQANKTIVLGMQERGGRIEAHVIPNVKMTTLRKAVLEAVEPGTKISTDELVSYGLLSRDGYEHGRVRHSTKEYARGEHHVNTVEGFWRIFKAAIRSTHIHVSPKYMDRYVREFTFRSNHRAKENAMFDLLIAAF